MIQRSYHLVILITLITRLTATKLEVISPIELANQFTNGIPIHVSPIGFKPLSGRLDGITILSMPGGACSIIQDVHS